MAKRKERGVDLVAAMPWPVGIVLGIVAYLAIKHGIPWVLGSSGNPILQGLGRQVSGSAFAPLPWVALALCWIGALVSFVRGQHRRRLLNMQSGLGSISAISWRQFEMLVGEAFRRQGYTIQETGLGGADGGIDLILRKNGATTLVQCKRWRKRRVDVKVVREMCGLLSHHHAAAVKIVAIGDYTPDARRFAQGKPIELIHGEALLTMIRAVQTIAHAPAAATSTPAVAQTKTKLLEAPNCPKCGTPMVQRTNRRTNDYFWGCPTYPACRGTRPA